MLEMPTELDLLDPAPRPPRRRPPPRPPKGDVEKALDLDLKTLPPAYRKGTIAATARLLARALDAGNLTERGEEGHAAQIRQCMVQLHEWAPAAEPGDATGEAQARSESARNLYVLPSAE